MGKQLSFSLDGIINQFDQVNPVFVRHETFERVTGRIAEIVLSESAGLRKNVKIASPVKKQTMPNFSATVSQ